MRKAYLVSCSDHYGDRLEALAEALREMGLEPVYMTSDFDHQRKVRCGCPVPGGRLIHVPAYRRNLSPARLYSHRCFAEKAFRQLDRLAEEPALVAVLLPPNSLAARGAWYKRRHPGVKLVYDLFDMWPESFPGAGEKPLLRLPFAVWRRLRDEHLRAADEITSECALFLTRLPKGTAGTIIPLTRPEAFLPPAAFPGEGISLCYLGSINHVADLEGLCVFLRAVAARTAVTLHIIGRGERCDAFREMAEGTGAQVLYHGPLYDPVQKAEALRGCHFGLNFMREDACIGLTMKSVDYLSHGLPLISNVPGDTRSLLEEGGGIHCDPRRPEEAAAALLSLTPEGYTALLASARRLYREHFNPEIIREAYVSLYTRLLAIHPEG